MCVYTYIFFKYLNSIENKGSEGRFAIVLLNNPDLIVALILMKFG
jgi:hypothetical protein